MAKVDKSPHLKNDVNVFYCLQSIIQNKKTNRKILDFYLELLGEVNGIRLTGADGPL